MIAIFKADGKSLMNHGVLKIELPLHEGRSNPNINNGIHQSPLDNVDDSA